MLELFIISMYLFIGIVIQLLGQLISRKSLIESMNSMDLYLHREVDINNDIYVDNCRCDKRIILVNVLAWPINLVFGIYVMIKGIMYYRNKRK